MKHLNFFLLMCVACAATGWGHAQNITSSEVKFRYYSPFASGYYLSETSAYGDVCFKIDNANNTSATFDIVPVGGGRYLMKTGTRYLFANAQKDWGFEFYTDDFDEANGYFSGDWRNTGYLRAVNAVRQNDALYVLGDEQVSDDSNLDELAQSGTIKKIDLSQTNNFTFSFSKCGIIEGKAIYTINSDIGASVGINDADGIAKMQGISSFPDRRSRFFMESETNFDPDGPNYDGQFGENIHWELKDGTLTISGTGPMSETDTPAPWGLYIYSVTNIVITNGITTVRASEFREYANLASVTLPESLISIGASAFEYSSQLTSVTVNWTVAEDLPTMGYDVFTYISPSAVLHVPPGTKAIYKSGWGGYFSSISDGSSTQTWNCGTGGSASVTATLSDGTLTISGTGDMEDYLSNPIPWESYKSSITAAVIGNGVTSIGSFAFYDCSSLTSVTIPATVTAIGEGAFAGCIGLISITIPDNVTSIERYTFADCSSLTSITLPNSVNSIGEHAFLRCSSLASITIPGSVISIADRAFTGAGLTSITFTGENLTSIGEGVFFDCSNLTSITFPNSVNSIGEGVFFDCSSLTSVTLPESLTSIERFTFRNCSRLTSITIPTGVISIGEQAFYNCTGLTAITIPANVTTIGYLAFSGCSGLTSITIPASVTSIVKAFDDCSSLTDITVETGNTAYSSEGGVLFNDAKTVLIKYPEGKTGASYSIPNSVTSIGEHAFFACSNLTSVFIPESMTDIGGYAFSGCSGLTSVTILATVPPSLGLSAFNAIAGNCTLTVPAGSKSAYESSAWNSYFSSITGGSSGAQTWNCGPGGSPSVIATLSDGTLTISGTGDMGNYSGATPWGSYKSSITAVVIEDGVTSIGSFAFGNCSSLTAITLPENLTSIGSGAFLECSSLTAITIPDGVTVIENLTFAGCTSLTSITLPENLISIESAFLGCISLASITLPGNLISIRNAFSGCSSLASITIPASVTSIGSGEFDNCSSLTDIIVEAGNTVYSSEGGVLFNNAKSVLITYPAGKAGAYIIPNSVTDINSRAFWGCSNLTFVTIPDNVVSIESYAFYNCSSLTSITLPGSITAIGEGAFAGCTQLNHLTVNWVTPLSVSGDVFDGVSVSSCTLHVPAGLEALYQAAPVWKDFSYSVNVSLTVSPSSLDFAATGGSQDVNVVSNRDWTAGSDASWLTVTQESGSVLRIAATANTGYARTDIVKVTAEGLTQLVYVTQDAAQQIIAEPKPPVNNQGSIEIALEIPVNEQFSITFTVTLPAGFVLDQQATSLVSGLLNSYRLSVTPNGQGGWLFEIAPAPALSLRSGEDTDYREIVNIVYTLQGYIPNGNYEVKIQDVDLTMDNGEVIHQDEINVPVRISGDVSNATVAATDVRYFNGRLYVNTPVAERITVYSLTGAAVYQSKKAEGAATFDLNSLPKGILIIRGESGWVRKIVR